MHRNRVLEHGGGQLVDALRHRRTVQQGLPVRIAVFRDAVDVTEETHVQHAVGFVENENINFGQVDIAQVHVAQHATRGHNGDVYTCGEGVFLAVKVTSASTPINGDARCAREVAKPFAGLVNLQRQLTGGRDDETFDVVSSSRLVDVVHGGQQKSRRLAGSSLRDANDVFPLCGWRNGQRLDGCGQFESHGVQPVLDCIAQRQFPERNFFGFFGGAFLR